VLPPQAQGEAIPLSNPAANDASVTDDANAVSTVTHASEAAEERSTAAKIGSWFKNRLP
jgi:hypothetical protein